MFNPIATGGVLFSIVAAEQILIFYAYLIKFKALTINLLSVRVELNEIFFILNHQIIKTGRIFSDGLPTRAFRLPAGEGNSLFC